MYRNCTRLIMIPLITLMTLIGCNEQSTEIAREAADRQAGQNLAMVDLQTEVAAGTKNLVEADAQAREGVIDVHRDLLAERTRLDTGWTDLEHQRRQLAEQRRSESILVPALETVGLLALVALALGFSWYALVKTRQADDSDDDIRELLLAEIANNSVNGPIQEHGIPPLSDHSQTDPTRHLSHFKEG